MFNSRSDNEDLPKKNEARISEALEWLNRLEVAQLELEQSIEKQFRKIMSMLDEIYPTGKLRVYQEEERSEVKGSDLQLVSVSVDTSNIGTNPLQVKPQHHTIVVGSGGETSEKDENPLQVQPEIEEEKNQVTGNAVEINQKNKDELPETKPWVLEGGKPFQSTIIQGNSRRYRDLTAPSDGTSEEKNLCWFTKGLRKEIWVGLRLYDPGGFKDELEVKICSKSYGSGPMGQNISNRVSYFSNPNFSSTKTLVVPSPTPNPRHGLTNPNSPSSTTLITQAPLLILRHSHANPNFFFTKTLISQPPSPSLLCDLVNRSTNGFRQLSDGKLQQTRSNDLYLWCIDVVAPEHKHKRPKLDVYVTPTKSVGEDNVAVNFKCKEDTNYDSEPDSLSMELSFSLALDVPAQFPGFLYSTTCSVLCNVYVIQCNPDKRYYDRIGESTDAALCVFVEEVAISILSSISIALNWLTELAYEGRKTSSPELELVVKPRNDSETESKMPLRSVVGRSTTKPMKMEVSFHFNYKFSKKPCSRIKVKMGSLAFEFEVVGGRNIVTVSIGPYLRNAFIEFAKDLSKLEGTKSERQLQEFANHSFSPSCVLECLASGGVSNDENDNTDISLAGESKRAGFNETGLINYNSTRATVAEYSELSNAYALPTIPKDEADNVNADPSTQINSKSGSTEVGSSVVLKVIQRRRKYRVDILRCESLANSSPVNSEHFFIRDYDIIVSLILLPPSALTGCKGPGHLGPPSHSRTTPWMKWALYTTAASGPISIVLMKGQCLILLQAPLFDYEKALGWSWGGSNIRGLGGMIEVNLVKGNVLLHCLTSLLKYYVVIYIYITLNSDEVLATATGVRKQNSNVMKAKPRKVNEEVDTGWIYFHFVGIGTYVELLTVEGITWWLLYSANGPNLSYTELVNYDSSSTRGTTYPCSIYDDPHPPTMPITVLVVQMLALDNLGENQFLGVIFPWSNMWLVGSIIIILFLHILIWYGQPIFVPFSVTPLTWARFLLRNERFSEIHLEDKVSVLGGGIVTPHNSKKDKGQVASGDQQYGAG